MEQTQVFLNFRNISNNGTLLVFLLLEIEKLTRQCLDYKGSCTESDVGSLSDETCSLKGC